MKLWLTTATFLTIFSLSFSQLHAQDKIGVLDIVIDDDFPPYTVQHSDESKGGLFVEILQGALRHSNLDFKMTGLPWKRVIAKTDRSQIDASLPWRAKKERFEKYNMVGPITKHGSDTVFWARKDFKGEEWTHLTDLKGYRIGTISGYAYPSDFEQADFLKKMEMTVTNGTLIKMLAAGRLDLIIGDQHVLAVEALKKGLSGQFKQVGPALETVKRYIAVPKSKKSIASKIGNALRTFQDTPQYQTILRKYQ